MKTCFIIFVLLQGLLFSQPYLNYSEPEKSIHQLEWENHRAFKKGDAHIDIVDNNIIPLKESATAVLSKKVFGFLPDWEYPQAMDNLKFNLLTHIAAFDFYISDDGAIANPSGWPWTDLINEAHSNGVKVILTAVNFNGSEIHNLISNTTSKNNFFNNLQSKISLYSLDGVNIDFEGLNDADKGANINNFMAELTEFIHSNIPGAEVSFDGPAVNWSNLWDFAGLAAACDYIFIMGYAFSGSWSSNSASTAPLTGGSYNITNTVQSQYSSVVNSTPEKLILGVPYYGEEFHTVNNQAHASVVDYIGSTRFKNSKSASIAYGALWDAPTASPWFRYQNDEIWFQVWADNARSIDEKFDLADSKSLLGVGMWALNYDGSENDLWNVIIDHYGAGFPIVGEPLNFSLRSNDQSSLKVNFSEVAFANGYWLYYSKDGLVFEDSMYFSATDSVLSGLDSNTVYFAKVRAIGGAGLGSATGLLAATTHLSQPSDALIVDGFDRQSGNNTRDYIRMHAMDLFNEGVGVSSATNEAVSSNKIDPVNYRIVDWILGDESTADESFSTIEQEIVKDYLKQGGYLMVSGAEIGWDLGRSAGGDKNFYNNYLKAEYINDAPNGEDLTYNAIEALPGGLFSGLTDFTFDYLGDQGTYEVDWPDAINAINGAQNILRYKDAPNANIAAIVFEGMFPEGTQNGKLVYFGFPFETIYPQESRSLVMNYIINFFEGNISKIADELQTAQKFTLFNNYPNPFNPSTKISFYLDKPGNTALKIFDINGREVTTLKEGFLNTGLHVFEFNAARYASGIYIYEVRSGQHRLRKKMMLVK